MKNLKKEIKENIDFILEIDSSLRRHEVIHLAILIQQNRILQDGLGTNLVDNLPVFLEEIAINSKARKDGKN